MFCPARVHMLEPCDIGQDFFVGDDCDQVAFAEAGVLGEPGLGLVDHGVLEVEPQVGVDIEGEVQHSGAFVDVHGGAVTAEDFDRLVVGVAGLDLIDIADGEIGVGIPDAAVEEAKVFQLCAHKESVQVVHLVGEQEVAGVFVSGKAVLDQVETLGREYLVKIVEEHIIWVQVGLFFAKFIAHDERDVVKRDVVLVKEGRPVIFEVRGAAADLAVNADTGALIVDQVHDIPAIAAERRVAVIRAEDLFQRIEGFLAGITVSLQKKAVLSVDVLIHVVVLYFETEIFENICQVVRLCKPCHGNDDRLGVLGLWDAFLFFNSGEGIEVVDPVGDFYQKSLAGHLALQLGVRKEILLRLSWGAIGTVEVFVAQGCNRIYDVSYD